MRRLSDARFCADDLALDFRGTIEIFLHFLATIFVFLPRDAL